MEGRCSVLVRSRLISPASLDRARTRTLARCCTPRGLLACPTGPLQPPPWPPSTLAFVFVRCLGGPAVLPMYSRGSFGMRGLERLSRGGKPAGETSRNLAAWVAWLMYGTAGMYVPLAPPSAESGGERTDPRWEFHAGRTPETRGRMRRPSKRSQSRGPSSMQLQRICPCTQQTCMHVAMYVRRPAQSPCHQLTPRPR